MPEWNFFAFDSVAVAKSVLLPAQEAVRNRDLAAWQKVFDILNTTHFRPHVSRRGFSYNSPYTLVNGIVTPEHAILRGTIAEESSFGLRRTLQTFIELISRHFVSSLRVKLWNEVMNLIRWEKILTSQEELDEMQMFREKIIAPRKKLPDPFWCLESIEGVYSNYAEPETVAKMAEVESDVGLFRRLVRRTDVDGGIRAIAAELATAGLLIELAATREYGLYFREDAT